jgi:hypothetical protein
MSPQEGASLLLQLYALCVASLNVSIDLPTWLALNEALHFPVKSFPSQISCNFFSNRHFQLMPLCSEFIPKGAQWYWDK